MSNQFSARHTDLPGYAGYEFVEQIMQMNATYAQPVEDVPRLRPDPAAKLRRFKEILQDELNEVDDIIRVLESDGAPSEVVLTSIADWLGDIIVYCTSEMVKYGLPPLAVLQIIMASNFSKLDENGQPIMDASGQKFEKGPNYWKPEPMIEDLLRTLMQESQR